MKLSIERGALLKAVSQAQSVVERRNTIPILANVLIEAEGEHVQFRATDLDIEVVDKTVAQVERAGATTVSAVTLHEIVQTTRRRLGNTDRRCSQGSPDRGRRTIKLLFGDPTKEDFPLMASSEYDSNFSAPAPVLRRLFDKSKLPFQPKKLGIT